MRPGLRATEPHQANLRNVIVTASASGPEQRGGLQSSKTEPSRVMSDVSTAVDPKAVGDRLGVG
jgi:hypothetical protein